MEYWTIILSILVVIYGIYYYLSSRNTNVFQQHRIPYIKQPSLLQFLGRIFLFPKSMLEHVHEMYSLHPDAKYIGNFDLTKPVLMIRDLDLLKSITIKNFDSFIDHNFLGADNLDPLFGNNLISLRGDKWRNVRTLLSPAFTSSKMKLMFQLMSECAVNFTERLSNVPPEERIMEIKDVFSKFATDVIGTCAFGISVDSLKNPENDFYVHGKKGANLTTFAVMKMLMYQHMSTVAHLLKLKLLDDRTNEFFVNLVSDTIKTRDEKNISRPDMLQLMMDSRGKREPGKELTIQDMTSQAFIFFLGGFDSTSSAMCFAAHEIAVNPHVQARLYDEIEKVLKDTNGQPSYEAINGMTYLNAVISEALRIYPSTPMIDRLCVKDFELPAAMPDAKPYIVKKGMSVWLPYYGFHHDAKYFPEPDKFKPERFLDGSERDQCNFDAYLPFGIGPRMCIGNRFALLEIKVLLFHLLARCELKPCEKTLIPIKFKKLSFTLQAKDGFWLNVTKRENLHSTIVNAN